MQKKPWSVSGPARRILSGIRRQTCVAKPALARYALWMQTRTFRITTLPHERPLVEALLEAQGFAFTPEPYYAAARRLEREPFPLGSSLAAFFGLIYIQDRSSMLPPALLGVQPGEVCLDMCASPGGKTGILADQVGRDGFVLAAEASRERLATLRQNLRRMGALNAATIGAESQHLELAPESFDAILLDPPCSGWGTVDKNPKVLELWTPEKAETLVKLQRELFSCAARLLKPGGRLMFSTCTTNVRENEEQAAWALSTLPLTLDPLPAPEGFARVPLALPGLDGVLRVGGQEKRGQDTCGDAAPHAGGQGFFLARFRKTQGSGREADALNDAYPPLAGRELGPKDFAQARESGADFSMLPPGEVREFGGKAYFLHQAALDLCESAGLGAGAQRWQGFLLGQVQGGRFVPAARTRALMPPAGTLPASHTLNVDEPALILDLLAGRSLEAPGSPAAKGKTGKESVGLTGLYFQGLALGWLTRKGRRLLWSDR